MSTPYRLCKAGAALRSEVNATWPSRQKASDGWIGDAAHATRTSDHNPWLLKHGVGIVRALDIDRDLLGPGQGGPMAELMEHLRAMGAKRDPRLYPGGYLIFNKRITQPDFGSWRAYTGANPHTQHGHVSFSTDLTGFDTATPWGLAQRFSGGQHIPDPPSQEDDMTPEQATMLAEVHAALCRPLKAWAGGGTGDPKVDSYTLPQYVLRQNVEEYQRKVELAALRSQVTDLYALLRQFPQLLSQAINK